MANELEVRITNESQIMALDVIDPDPETEIAKILIRFNPEDLSKAEISVNGKDWNNIKVIHKALQTFIDKYPFEFE